MLIVDFALFAQTLSVCLSLSLSVSGDEAVIYCYVTHHEKYSGFKPHKILISQFFRSGDWHGAGGFWLLSRKDGIRVSAGLPSFLESVEESPFQGHCGAGRIQALAFVGLRFHSSPTGCRLGPVSAPCGQAGIPSHVASSGFTPAAERKSFSCFQTAQHSHCAVLDESEDEPGSASGSHPPGLGREPFLEFF